MIFFKPHVALFLFSLIFILNSCQKKTCKCTTTLREAGYMPYETSSYQDLNKNYTKKKAKKLCESASNPISASVDEIFLNPNIQVSTNCELTGY